MSGPMQTAFGYRSSGPAADLDADEGQQRIQIAAHQEGFAVAVTFFEPAGGESGLAALIDAARRDGVRTVIVADPADLGSSPAAQGAVRRRLRAAELAVLIAGDTRASRSWPGPRRGSLRAGSGARQPAAP